MGKKMGFGCSEKLSLVLDPHIEDKFELRSIDLRHRCVWNREEGDELRRKGETRQNLSNDRPARCEEICRRILTKADMLQSPLITAPYVC
jgi:hypothetical protein